VALPTETVYGLAAHARDPVAVRRVFARKGRPADHPLIVHLAAASQVGDWAVVPARHAALVQALTARFWPGPLTLVLPRQAGVPDEVTGGLPTVGLRVPAHPLAQATIRALGAGVAAPSANRFGRISPTCAAHVHAEFGDEVAILDGGPCPVGVESTILDLSGEVPALLRQGGVPEEELLPLTGPLGTSSTPAPGTLAAHYAPRTGLLLTRAPAAEAQRLRDHGRTVAVLTAAEAPAHARELYARLRDLDALGVDVLVAELAEERGLGRAVNDRLRRAAVGAAAGGDGPTG
jgi:L-threonylcarbamoyladenylate synthase